MNKKYSIINGFTLIELLVVILIIGILISVSLVGVQGARESARDARRRSDLESIRSAIQLYKADCNVYPVSPLGTQIVADGTCGDAAGTVYLQSVPTDPQGGAYLYNRMTNLTYELCARLETVTTSASCGAQCNGATCTYRTTNP